MIDSSSGTNSPFKILGERGKSAEDLEKSKAIENISKVGGDQHKRTLAFLVQSFDQSLDQSSAGAAQETGSQETKKEAKRNQTDGRENKINSTSSAMNLDASVEEIKKEVEHKKTENNKDHKNAEVKSPLTNEKSPPVKPEIGVTLPVHKPETGPLEPPSPSNPPPNAGQTISQLTASNAKYRIAALTAMSINISNMLGESAQEKMEANSAFQKKSSEVSLENIKTTEAEQAEAQRQGEQGAKIFSCVMAALTAVVTVIMVGLSLASGNVALIAITIAGLIVMVTDLILDANGLPTIMGTILAPLMKYVITPITNFFADIISKVLESFGVEKRASDMVGVALGMLGTVGVAVGVGVAVKNSAVLQTAVSRVAGALGNAVARATPAVCKTLAQKLTSTVSQFGTHVGKSLNIGGTSTTYSSTYASAVGSGATKDAAEMVAVEAAEQAYAAGMQAVTGTLSIAGQAAGLVSVAVGTAGTVTGAVFQYQVTDLRQDLERMFQNLANNSDIMKETQSHLRAMYDRANELMNIALETQGMRNDTAKAIIQNIGKSV